jgi:cobalt/nickel transport protein
MVRANSSRIPHSLIPALFVACLAGPAQAHFGMLIPSNDVVLDKASSQVRLALSFSHPMEGEGMDMARPMAFGVRNGEQATDLLPTLKPARIMGHAAWTADYQFQRPGLAIFHVRPAPYFEPAEDKFIEHLTKVIVPAFGEEEGWDTPLGLPAEIVPLTRPFGNYAGNLFSAQVLVDGKPVPGVEVEVEHYNQRPAYEAPNPHLVTQVVKTDANGVFHYAVPFAGWWGFAALTEAPTTLKHQGVDKPVERGAVLWTRFVDPKRKR